MSEHHDPVIDPQFEDRLRTLLERAAEAIPAGTDLTKRVQHAHVQDTYRSRAHARTSSGGAIAAISPRHLLAPVAAVVVVALLAGVFVMAHGFGLVGTTSQRAHPTPAGGPASTTTAVNTSGVTSLSLTSLGKFSSYRGAYLGQDGRLHVVAHDGTNLTGPALPFADFIRANYPDFDVAVAPSGRYLAYVETGDPSAGGPVALLNLTTGAFVSISVHAQNLMWSPDSTQVAVSAPTVSNTAGNVTVGAALTVTVITASTGKYTTVAATRDGQPATIERVVGWRNATHLIVFLDAPAAQASIGTAGGDRALNGQLSGPPQVELGSLDVSTGQVRVIANLPTLPSASVWPDGYLSPDGTEVFIAPSSVNQAEVIDTATGQARALPAITQAFGNLPDGADFAMATAWQPNTHVLALSLSQHFEANEGAPQPGTQASGVWLLDVDGDTATRVTRNTYPLAWVPGTQTLLTADPPGKDASGVYPYFGAGVGPTLYAVTPVQPGAAETRLANGMAVYLGLLRTA